MDGVDVVLGCAWMQLVGTININVEKKFVKLWYKKKKITLQDMSLLPQIETEKEKDEVLAGEPIPKYDTSNDESMVESKEDNVQSHEENYEAGNIPEE